MPPFDRMLLPPRPPRSGWFRHTEDPSGAIHLGFRNRDKNTNLFPGPQGIHPVQELPSFAPPGCWTRAPPAVLPCDSSCFPSDSSSSRIRCSCSDLTVPARDGPRSHDRARRKAAGTQRQAVWVPRVLTCWVGDHMNRLAFFTEARF